MLLLLSLLLKAPARMAMLDLQRHIPAADTNVGPHRSTCVTVGACLQLLVFNSVLVFNGVLVFNPKLKSKVWMFKASVAFLARATVGVHCCNNAMLSVHGLVACPSYNCVPWKIASNLLLCLNRAVVVFLLCPCCAFGFLSA